VALARALITAPRALLLDEPFSALDAELRQSLSQEFRQRIAQAGMATLLVTHDEAEARAIHGANVIRCQINRLQLVGHIMQIALTLPNGDSVALEGHVDKYRGLLVAGEPGYVAWSPEDATLIVG